MYSEVLRIIEGGMSRDTKKVFSYSKLLAEKLQKDGDIKMSKMIIDTVERRFASTIALDELSATPIDQESRLSIVDMHPPTNENLNLVLQPNLENRIEGFINMIVHQSELLSKGVEVPCSLMLYGVPGCGKTTIAKYVSQKTNLPLVVARFDALVSSLLGSTAKNIRKVFEYAERQPCILFLDEFDAIAKARNDVYEMGELKRVINSLIQNIDNFPNQSVLIAATNHPELLDRAIWRRFNTVLEVGLPNPDGIKKLLELFVGDFPNTVLSDNKKKNKITQLMAGKSPSAIETIINNAKALSILSGDATLKYENLLMEIYEHDLHDSDSKETLIDYLYDNGISQSEIAEILKMSLRKIKTHLKQTS